MKNVLLTLVVALAIVTMTSSETVQAQAFKPGMTLASVLPAPPESPGMIVAAVVLPGFNIEEPDLTKVKVRACFLWENREFGLVTTDNVDPSGFGLDCSRTPSPGVVVGTVVAVAPATSDGTVTIKTQGICWEFKNVSILDDPTGAVLQRVACP